MTMTRQRTYTLPSSRHRCLQLGKGKQKWYFLPFLACAVALVFLLGHRADRLYRRTANFTQNDRSSLFHIGIVTTMESTDRQVGPSHAKACPIQCVASADTSHVFWLLRASHTKSTGVRPCCCRVGLLRSLYHMVLYVLQVSEVVTYLLPSWAYTIAQPEAARNIVDLLIFCEQPFCALLPPSCRQLVSDSGKPFAAGHRSHDTALQATPLKQRSGHVGHALPCHGALVPVCFRSRVSCLSCESMCAHVFQL